MSTEAKIAQARLWLLARLPYFVRAAYLLVPREVPDGTLMGDPSTPTIAVTDRAVLLYEPGAIAAWSVAELGAALAHEVCHLLRHHHARGAALQAHPVLWNLAGDLAINQDLAEAKIPLPAGSLYPALFGFPQGQTAEEYYAALLALAGPPKPGQGPCSGSCGGCSGNPSEAEAKYGQGDEVAPRTEMEVEVAKKEVAQSIQAYAEKERAKGRPGTVPGGWVRWAEETLKPPVVRWQDVLARTVRRAVAYKAGAVDYKYGRPSRRQAGIGYGPGRPVLPGLVAPVPDVWVALDTSGSMGPGAITASLAEVRGVLNAVGSKVTFLSCDTEVHAIGQVVMIDEVRKLVKGGGGTDFHPIFDAVAKARVRPNVVIVATDGWGDAPTQPLPDVHTVWLLIGSTHKPCTWGDVVEVP